MKQTRTAPQIRSLLEEYRRSGLSRREFAQRQNLPLTTLDYWRRKHGQPRLVEVRLEAKQPATSFSIVLGKGRRIEKSGNFFDAELGRLIRIVESA
jgi:hypothetical protein